MRGFILALILSLIFFSTEQAFSQELVIYSGRSKSLIEPIIKQFEKETGIRARVRYGDTSQLAVAILEEGNRSPADLFWAQDAGALGVLSARNMFLELPDSIVNKTPVQFRSSGNTWVATSGRARVVAYSSTRISTDELPNSIYDLTDLRWRNRIGWAPQNASFQTFVSAMIKQDGREKTKEWLTTIRNNGAKNYRSNVPIIQAIADGEIDIGITNHYYLIRFKKSNPDYPVEQIFLQPGDLANFVNVAGAGILKSAANTSTALRFINYLLSPQGQQFFTSDVYEYPVVDNVIANPLLLPFEDLLMIIPQISLDALDNLDDTLRLLREIGLL